KILIIFNNVTAKTEEQLTSEFLDLEVFQSPALNDIVSLIFDKVVNEPDLFEVYAKMCTAQSKKSFSQNFLTKFFSGIFLCAEYE
ncbi:hypothetical protein PENTCL1PPCAC_12435, partial [Pristionchus entomophagus]